MFPLTSACVCACDAPRCAALWCEGGHAAGPARWQPAARKCRARCLTRGDHAPATHLAELSGRSRGRQALHMYLALGQHLAGNRRLQ